MASKLNPSCSDFAKHVRCGLLANSGQRFAGSSRFAPELCYGRHRGAAGPGTRPAAVVVLLYPNRGAWYLPLILRPASMNDHAGQVGLPGGGSEPGESAVQCALRELDEELGVRPNQVEIIGQLAPILVFASNFHVTPFVATSNERPEFRPNSSEVEELFELPLAHILDQRRWDSIVIKRGQLSFRAPSFALQGRHIWGATGLILGELVERIGDAFQ